MNATPRAAFGQITRVCLSPTPSACRNGSELWVLWWLGRGRRVRSHSGVMPQVKPEGASRVPELNLTAMLRDETPMTSASVVRVNREDRATTLSQEKQNIQNNVRDADACPNLYTFA